MVYLVYYYIYLYILLLYIYLQFYSKIKNIYLAAHGLLLPWEAEPGVKTYRRTAWTEKNEGRYPGGVLPEKPVPSCWDDAGAGGFLIAGQLRPVNAPQSGRNGAVFVWTAEDEECTM